MKKLLLATVTATALFAAGAPARADVTFTPMNNNQSFTGQNIISHSTLGHTGTTVYGETNQTHTGFSFTATEQIMISGGSGFASIETTSNTDEFINNLTIAILPGQQYNAFDPMGLSLFAGGAQTDGGTVTFYATAYSPLGVLEPVFVSQTFTLTQGENKFLIDAIGGEVLTQVQFIGNGISALSINELRQTSVTLTTIPPTGTPPVDVPEPASLALMGMGLLGLGALARRRRRTETN